MSNTINEAFGSRYNTVQTNSGMILRVDDETMEEMSKLKKIAYVLSYAIKEKNEKIPEYYLNIDEV